MSLPRKIAPIPALEALTLALALAGALAGCASKGTFPSLARRPQEVVPGRIGGPAAPTATASGTVPAPLPSPTLSPELVARASELGDAARAAHERFAGKRARAAQLVRAAGGSPAGSEAWAAANVALAGLAADRSATMVPLADLDALYAAQRVDGGDGGAIAAVRDQVTAWVADEDAVLAELGGLLPG